MKVAHVIASVDDPAAGPSQSVPALARALASHSAHVWIHTIAAWRGATPNLDNEDLEIHRHRPDGGPLSRRMATSSTMRTAIERDAQHASIIHSHGLWLAPNLYPAAAARRPGARAKLVLSPRGMLGKEALAFSPWRKRLVWTYLQQKAAASTHCLHATAESELQEIRAMGLRNPVAVIPNGVHIGPARNRHFNERQMRTVLSLGRIHPVKGLDRLLAAWAIVEPQRPEWRLRILGPAENGHDLELHALTAKLGLSRVSIEGPVFRDDKAEVFSDADLFVLPSLNENFAMTVAEALGSGVPVIASKGAPWAGLETECCGWWIDHGPVPLASALLSATGMKTDRLGEMGSRGRAWMMRDYSWDRVGAEMLSVYEWLTAGGPKPPSVVHAP